MIALEIKKADFVVRIHDDYCQQATDRQLASISQILSDAHKRWLYESSEIMAIQKAPTAS